MCRLPLLFLSLALMACSEGGGGGRQPLIAGSPGDPLPGLDPAELERFRQGEVLFNKVFTPEEGLGPLFNENQCSACHTDPAPGGTGDQFVTKATRWSPDSGCDLLTGSGGENVRTRGTALLRAHGIQGEEVPREATEVGRFVVPYLFGLGLAEALPEERLEALADPEDRNGDGISGRLARTADGRMGLFGRKGDFASLADFNAGAFLMEMGITNPLHPGPETLNGGPLPPGVDPAADPEVGEATLALVMDFVRFLAPLARRVPSDPEALAQVERGEALFRETGCTSCHVPVLETGHHAVEALSRKAAAFYSDFLLHDLGAQVAGTCGPDAAPTEHRTGILMGVGLRDLFLHSGDATSLEEAILRHGGEAQRAQQAFQGLSELDRHYLIRFLETL
ncbi:MAG: di-heme oxidoredictase family protein [Longimicrobiales bacterium]